MILYREGYGGLNQCCISAFVLEPLPTLDAMRG